MKNSEFELQMWRNFYINQTAFAPDLFAFAAVLPDYGSEIQPNGLTRFALAGLPFIQEKFVSNQNILPSVHQVIKSQSRAEDCRACAWA